MPSNGRLLPAIISCLLPAALLLPTGARAQLFDAHRTQWIDQVPFPGEDAEQGDRFGRALASGDLDCDGFDDLIVGVPLESLGVNNSLVRAGTVHVLFGGVAGLTFADARTITEGDLFGAVSTSSAEFGKVLAVGDFDGDGCDDLAIGVPEVDQGGLDDVGAVWEIPGGPGGPELSLARRWSQADPDISDGVEALDHFGSSLATGDLNGDGFDDLAIGGFGEAIGSLASAGAVWLLPGGPDGLRGAFDAPTGWRQLINQGLGAVDETAEVNDRFGTATEICDLDGDGIDDLIVSASGEDEEPELDNGVVHFFASTAAGVLPTDHPDPGSLPQAARYGPEGEGMGFSLASGEVSAPPDDCIVLASAPLASDGIGRVNLFSLFQPLGMGTFIHQGTVGEVLEEDDLFGWAMATGDFGGAPGREEAVLASPGEHVPGFIAQSHGMVHISHPSTRDVVGFAPFTNRWTNAHSGSHEQPPGPPRSRAQFGYALAAGDFDGDGFDDLAIAAPDAHVFSRRGVGQSDAGAVQVLYAAQLLFSDGFEAGNALVWSSVVP
ncbi:MAG: hypothetical protein DWQ36_06140 [Acidobacteria bacterium]|nr:MAG: hypothetical protein DWQ30_19145 [Acidobacteriota bacterium]REK09627.1 MAG: hypothetical protein DWQ36_06140 [Acidobacteriota bacterium]